MLEVCHVCAGGAHEVEHSHDLFLAISAFSPFSAFFFEVVVF
jgi:hypothetical protein